MPDWTRVEKQHVLTALNDYDRLGDREFLRRFGFGRARAHTLWHRGNEYDVPAVLGAAYLHATGHAPSRSDLAGDEAGAAKTLADLGFDIAVDEEAAEQLRVRTPPARKTAPKPAVAKPVNVCSRCHMALPASGQCDFCD